MLTRIEIKDLIKFASGLEGKLITTKARSKHFQVNVLNGNLEFIPHSSGKVRKELTRNLTKVVNYFNKTKFVQPKDYHELTYNSVYIITIIEAYLRSLKKQDS